MYLDTKHVYVNVEAPKTKRSCVLLLRKSFFIISYTFVPAPIFTAKGNKNRWGMEHKEIKGRGVLYFRQTITSKKEQQAQQWKRNQPLRPQSYQKIGNLYIILPSPKLWNLNNLCLIGRLFDSKGGRSDTRCYIPNHWRWCRYEVDSSVTSVWIKLTFLA